MEYAEYVEIVLGCPHLRVRGRDLTHIQWNPGDLPRVGGSNCRFSLSHLTAASQPGNYSRPKDVQELVGRHPRSPPHSVQVGIAAEGRTTGSPRTTCAEIVAAQSQGTWPSRMPRSRLRAYGKHRKLRIKRWR